MPEEHAQLSADDIVSRLRREAARLARQEAGSSGLRSGPARLGRLQEPTWPLPPQQSYQISDFLDLPPRPFLRAAYLALLGREPDADGQRHYLGGLESGSVTRVGVLARLSRSAEAKRRGVRIEHLYPLAAFFELSRIPVLGYGLQLLLAPCLLPLLCKLWTNPRPAAYRALESVREQTNASLAEIQDRLEAASMRLDWLENESLPATDEKIEGLRSELQALATRQAEDLLELRRSLIAVQRHLEEPAQPSDQRETPVPRDSAPGAASDQSLSLESMFVAFEDQFRGSREEVKEALRVYLPSLQAGSANHPGLPVIDLGCGRGEWLELLAEQSIPARGVDLNRVCVQECRQHGLEAVQDDALGHLAGLQPDSLAGLTAFHLIEHLPLETMVALMDEALRVLAPGCPLILETPNPRNILVGASDFYRDPSHLTPIFPDTLAFIGRQRGFASSAVFFFDQERQNFIPASGVAFNDLQDYLDISRDYVWYGVK